MSYGAELMRRFQNGSSATVIKAESVPTYNVQEISQLI
jgi:hypothetical protein